MRQANKEKWLEWARAHNQDDLRMLCRQMKHPYSSSATRGSAAGRKANDPAQSPMPSIQSRCMCGLELDGMEPPKSVFLMV